MFMLHSWFTIRTSKKPAEMSNLYKFLIPCKNTFENICQRRCREFDVMHCSGRNIDTVENRRSGYTFLGSDLCQKGIILGICAI